MKLKLGFTGDIAFSEYTKNLRNEKNAISRDVFKILGDNDYNILNFESPITESNITLKNALAHKSHPDNLKYIKNNFKNPILSLANNHMMDFGIKGVKDTIKYVKDEELPFVGIGMNEDEATDYIVLGDELKVGVISFQYKDYMIATSNSPGPAHDSHYKLIRKKIKELRAKVDWVVLVYHGGEEFLNFPMPYTRRKFHKFLNWGVDVIVAHHPHTVQGYEVVGKNKIIFYSLGNFIFDTDFQRAQDRTDEGIIINLTFFKDSFDYEVVPIIKNRNKNIINIVKRNKSFVDISYNYNKRWKSEIIRLNSIRKIKKKLKFERRKYSVSNLHIEKCSGLNLVSFDELVRLNYISELEEKPKFNDKNIIVRKIKSKTKKINKLRKINKDVLLKIFYYRYALLSSRKK